MKMFSFLNNLWKFNLFSFLRSTLITLAETPTSAPTALHILQQHGPNLPVTQGCSFSGFFPSVWCQGGQTGQSTVRVRVLRSTFSTCLSTGLSVWQSLVKLFLSIFILPFSSFLLLVRSDILTSLFSAVVCIHSVCTVCVFQSVCLYRLDVCNVALVDYPVQALSKALRSSRLTVLHLQHVQLSGMPLYTLGKTCPCASPCTRRLFFCSDF